MATDADDVALKEAARKKYFRDRAKLMELYGVWPDQGDWIGELKGPCYVVTERKSGFTFYAKSQHEIVTTFRSMGVGCHLLKRINF